MKTLAFWTVLALAACHQAPQQRPAPQPVAFHSPPPAGPTFHGEPCSTPTCSGHRAGYDWAAAHDIDDPDRCQNPSASFQRGCELYVDESETQANDRYDHVAPP